MFAIFSCFRWRIPPMNRRTIGLSLTLAMVLAPLAADEQPLVKVPLLGILHAGSPPSAAQRQPSPFWQELHERGWYEGQNIAVERRYAEGQLDRLPALAADLVQRRPDVIVTGGTLGVLAVQQATTTIPIVIQGAGALVEKGIVTSLARPGGNITGMESNPLELYGTRLELLKDVRLHLTRVALFLNPMNPGWNLRLPGLETEARALGLQLQRVEARALDEFEAAFAAIVEHRADALFIADEAPFRSPATRQRLLDFAATQAGPDPLWRARICRGWVPHGLWL
jgi:putative tryptophan/tyrosine transport system substrate-binding protein